jgi:hypothetical protein
MMMLNPHMNRRMAVRHERGRALYHVFSVSGNVAESSSGVETVASGLDPEEAVQATPHSYSGAPGWRGIITAVLCSHSIALSRSWVSGLPDGLSQCYPHPGAPNHR